MPLEKPAQFTQKALLSAANASNNVETRVCGQPLLARQFDGLLEAGITSFLIEVDNVPGELLSLTDHYCKLGCHIEFVRTAEDLRVSLQAAERLIVLAEELYIAPFLIRHLLEQPDGFLLTVDGRDENAAFERMDLNTRWAGFAVLELSTVASLGSLPEGWSIASSLLRQAMQKGVKKIALSQQDVQKGWVLLVNSKSHAATLSSYLMGARSEELRGFIERRLFTPAAVRLAPLSWRSPIASNIIDGAILLGSAITLLSCFVGWNLMAAGAAIATVFLHTFRWILRGATTDGRIAPYIMPLSYFLLLIAAVVAGYNDPGYAGDGVYSALIMAGLLLLSFQLNLPLWAQRVLSSLALVTLCLSLLMPAVGFTQAAQWISTGQLLSLIVAKWAIARPKKSK